MGQQSAGFHESPDRLKPETMDRHRAIVSLIEELEAVDWYDQRVDAATDEELRAVLAHNRDEEKEHAAMTLEWLRRRDPGFGTRLRTYLFTDKPILQAEKDAEAEGEAAADGSEGGGAPAADGSLGIGSLREVRR
jgi:ferritin-like protein